MRHMRLSDETCKGSSLTVAHTQQTFAKSIHDMIHLVRSDRVVEDRDSILIAHGNESSSIVHIMLNI